MAKKIMVNLDLQNNELQNVGKITTVAMKFVDGNEGAGKVLQSDASGEVSWANAASGNLAGLSDTDVSGLTAGDVLVYDGADSFDNKPMSGDIKIDANGATTIQAGVVDFAMLNPADITSDLDASATATQLVRADAVKSYADAAIATANAFTVKGGIDCSGNPDYPAADAGNSYRVTVAGKIGGASGRNVEVGDLIICFTDSTASGDQATVGGEWTVEQNNLEAATTDVAGYVELATVAEAQAKTDNDRAVTPAGLTDFGRKHTSLIGDGAATSIAVTHGLGTQYVIAQVFEEATGDMVEAEVELTNSTTTTFTFTVAPANNAIRVVIIG